MLYIVKQQPHTVTTGAAYKQFQLGSLCGQVFKSIVKSLPWEKYFRSVSKCTQNSVKVIILCS